MKALLLVLCAGIIVLILSYKKPGSAKLAQKIIATSSIDSPDFTTTIQPILQKNCSPCHFPGGKMYVKMPFDKGETIICYAAGALKRFKEPKEIELLKQFIESNKAK